MNWVVFAIVLAVHGSLTMVFAQIGNREAEQARTQTDTITALESANARLEQALAENAGLHAQLLVQAREAGVADERSLLAAEIHDTIAQGLTGIIAQLQAVTSTARTDPALAGEHLARAAALARHSLGEARRSVHDLLPAALEHDDLPGALKKTVTIWSQRTGVRVEFTVTGTAEPLHDEVGATLLRIAEEALANAARHADASRAYVTLSYMGDEISLDVRDDGRGFDPAVLPPYRGAAWIRARRHAGPRRTHRGHRRGGDGAGARHRGLRPGSDGPSGIGAFRRSTVGRYGPGTRTCHHPDRRRRPPCRTGRTARHVRVGGGVPGTR